MPQPEALPAQYWLRAGHVTLESGIAANGCVRIAHGRIQRIATRTDDDAPCFDFGDALLAPGFVDLHIHGREGCDVMDATRTSLETISRSLAAHGVTGFLGTTVTSDWGSTLAAFRCLGKAWREGLSGAQLLGAYSEGLFFANRHKGAHNEQFFLPLEQHYFEQIIAAADGALKVLALAAELEHAEPSIRWLRAHGIRVMLGHTDASFDQASAALAAGACGGVHVFNGMRGIHHRDPGCTGAVLMHERAMVEVIADGVHLHPQILKLIQRLKPLEQITLISDCINAGGLPDGQYRLGKLDVVVRDGVSRTLHGSLAGSTLTLEQAVRNMTRLAGSTLHEAITMASLNPARFLDLADELGSISEGKRASLTVLDPQGEVIATLVDGRCVFQREVILPEHSSSLHHG